MLILKENGFVRFLGEDYNLYSTYGIMLFCQCIGEIATFKKNEEEILKKLKIFMYKKIDDNAKNLDDELAVYNNIDVNFEVAEQLIQKLLIWQKENCYERLILLSFYLGLCKRNINKWQLYCDEIQDVLIKTDKILLEVMKEEKII